MDPTTPAARRKRAVLGGLAGGLVALAATPALAGTALADTADSTSGTTATQDDGTQQKGDGPTQPDPVTAIVGGTLSSIPGSDSATTPDDPTPKPQGAQYGDDPSTVIDGVPVEGTLDSVKRSASIIPGSAPGDYA